MGPQLVRLPSPASILVAAVAASLVSADSSRLLSALKKVIVALLVLNWRALPFVWHIDFYALIPQLYWKIWTKGEEKAMAIARDPFEVRTVTKKRLGFADADYNFHMSNSSYAKVLDSARFKWLLELVGPAFGNGIWSPLAATSFAFYREIPLGAKYDIDVHLVSYDDKWLYYAARFTTAPRKGSTERTLNCVAFSRSCFKLRGSRLTIPPARVLSNAGAGSAGDRTNWERALRLKKAGKARRWLEYGGALVARQNGKWTNGAFPAGEEGWEDDGMSALEDKRLKGYEVSRRFGDTSGWETL
ncbi:hypothetical protein JCM10207_001205 [Rhodosporidiobolus poonsookiae]